MVYATLEIIHLNQNQLNIVTLVVLQSLVLRIDVSEYSSFKTLLFKIIKFWLLECIKSASHHVFNRCFSFCFINLKKNREWHPTYSCIGFYHFVIQSRYDLELQGITKRRILNQKQGSSGSSSEILGFITVIGYNFS